MTTGEIKNILQDLTQKLRASYSPQKVILFGSYAYGEPRAESDIDLLIIKDTPERFIDRWVQVRHILSDPKRRFALEIFVLTPEEVKTRLAMGDQFVAEILSKGRVLYEA